MKDSDEVTYHVYHNENQTAFSLDVASMGFISYQELAACLIDFANMIKDDEESIFGQMQEIEIRDN